MLARWRSTVFSLIVSSSAICLSADGNSLFALMNGQVTHWNMAKGAVVRRIEVGEIQHLSWGANHPLLAGANTTKPPTLWDPAAGKRLATLEGHSGVVTAVAWAPTGKMVVTGSRDNTARVWESPAGKLARTLSEHGGAVTRGRRARRDALDLDAVPQAHVVVAGPVLVRGLERRL